VERHPGRCEQLARNLERMGAPWVAVRCADAREPVPGGPFDRVLLDAPCSDLGTLQSRPDVRWRKDLAQVGELAGLQRELLEAAADALAPGGTLVFSTCTISPQENELVVRALLEPHPELAAGDLGAEHPGLRHPSDPRFLRLLPHRDATDGFFVARLRRER
jgi:16S rRNA (cytosine967-C5)-methyltransferase